VEYGTDEQYMDMALDSIEGWRVWNTGFERPLYHEVGFLVLTTEPLEYDFESFAGASYVNVLKRGLQVDRLNPQLIAAMFPAFNSEVFKDGFYNPTGGYVESGKVIIELAEFARELEVEIHTGQTAEELVLHGNRVTGARTREGLHFEAGHTIVAAGAFTPSLLPEMRNYMVATGHPVFHLKPDLPASFMPPDFPVFAADIQNTGWYGFPYHPLSQIVKIANHGIGLPMDPELDPREVPSDALEHLRTFLNVSIPQLAPAPMTHARLCCYADTVDGHFWIDRHPELQSLTVATGGSGHAFKMAPLLGELIADTAESAENTLAERFKWREFTEETIKEEEARRKV
jgi:glycine/D-amino acid oxidase-like deaminating enzyme